MHSEETSTTPNWYTKARSRAFAKQRPSTANIPRIPLLIGTFFGAGLSPVASGTMGSLAAVALYVLIPGLRQPTALIVATLVIFIAGVWASNIIERAINTHDPGMIVADEVAGQWLALTSALFIGDPVFIGVAFLAFRFFDIVKLFPASLIERRQGGFAVMADDLIAGIYANIVAHLVLIVLHQLA